MSTPPPAPAPQPAAVTEPGDPRVLVLLEYVDAAPRLRVADITAPVLRADDLGALRGDGCFETIHVRGHAPFLLDDHLGRMTTSAANLALPLPERADLEVLAQQAVAAYRDNQVTTDTAPQAEPRGGDDAANSGGRDGPAPAGSGGGDGSDPGQELPEATMRLVCTRGPESGGPPTVYATVGPVAEKVVAQRRAGLAVATLSLGIGADVRGAAPWLLGGTKTLSYAVNMAVGRWAVEHGLDDVILTDPTGTVLEGPTSTVVFSAGDRLCTIDTDTGILPGTTAGHLLGRAGELGLQPQYRRAQVDELLQARTVWLCSSVRGPAVIRQLDGRALRPDDQEVAAVAALLGFPG